MFARLLFIVFIIAYVFGQDVGVANTTEELVKIGPSPDISTVVLFPDYPEEKFPAGEYIELILSFTNNGKHTFNVTSVQAFLMYPPNHKYFIQNYTTVALSLSVGPLEQASIGYSFQPDPMLEPREFDFVSVVHYSDEANNSFINVFSNKTIDIVEPISNSDLASISSFVGLIVLAVGGYFVYKFYLTLRKGKRVSTVSSEKSTRNEWLAGTLIKQKKPKTGKTGPKSPKGNKNKPKSNKSE